MAHKAKKINKINLDDLGSNPLIEIDEKSVYLLEFFSENTIKEMTLKDLKGKKVFHTLIGANKFIFDYQANCSSFYIMEVKKAGERKSHKLMII